MMEKSVAFTTTALSISQVENILRNPPVTTISTPPVNVKAGHVYVFKAENKENQGNF